jgi:hypothetical protein
MFTIRLLDVVAALCVVAMRAARRPRLRPPPLHPSRAAAPALGGGLRALRTLALCGVGFVAYSYALPPTTCSCLGPIFRRCDNSLRYVVALKSDLKNLASQQEIYYSDHGTFTADPVALGFVPSVGSQVEIHAGADRWSAVATHAALESERRCAISWSRDDPEPRAVVCDR